MSTVPTSGVTARHHPPGRIGPRRGPSCQANHLLVLHGPADEDHRRRSGQLLPPRQRRTQVRVAGPVQYQAQRPFVAVGEQQDDCPIEVRVRQQRVGDQKAPGLEHLVLLEVSHVVHHDRSDRRLAPSDPRFSAGRANCVRFPPSCSISTRIRRFLNTEVEIAHGNRPLIRKGGRLRRPAPLRPATTRPGLGGWSSYRFRLPRRGPPRRAAAA